MIIHATNREGRDAQQVNKIKCALTCSHNQSGHFQSNAKSVSLTETFRPDAKTENELTKIRKLRRGRHIVHSEELWT